MKSKPLNIDRKAYYAEAATWSQDVNGSLRASRNIAWIVAAGFGAVAVLEGFALAALTPLKSVVPYTVTVDRQTGYVETMQGVKPGVLSQDNAITQSFLAQYVTARETFDATDIQANYKRVTLWSSGAAREQYIRVMQSDQSPAKAYPRSTVVAVTVKSLSVLSPTSALVRFDTERSDNGGPSGARQSYTAVIGYKYSGAPLKMEDRLLNPLGFQVTSYRRDAETAGAGQ